jgi:small subunit ribosomal protein S10
MLCQKDQRRSYPKGEGGVGGVSQKERPPKVMTTKICIVIRSFDHPFFENHFGGLPPYTRKIGLPESRVLYTVLRSPHIDKKSREQFEMEIKKQFLVIKTERHELRKKFFRLKRRATWRT